ncbi:hypothetical protein [Streptosporangium sp. NPDC048865]|uniref:hypothetical protein n=1 Tax=Streptosporangium sp. NPDC048865 TaxID=3155766 RepID=UPI00342102E8
MPDFAPRATRRAVRRGLTRTAVMALAVVELGLASFRRWVGILEDHDDDNLRDFDLSLARLRKAAHDGLAYASVDSLATIGELRKII